MGMGGGDLKDFCKSSLTRSSGGWGSIVFAGNMIRILANDF